MPKLGEYRFILDTITFIYRTEEQAAKGIRAGGTGFFVAVPSKYAPETFHHIYVVTNVHVAKGERRILRINTRVGGVDLLAVDEWIFKEHGPDVAVAPVNLDPGLHLVEALRSDSWLLTRDELTRLEIDSGEDVFMVGRFVDYDGVQTNRPSLRFGNISMIEADIRQTATGYLGPSIVVDMHSRTGYSGSPVFVYRTGGSIFAKEGTIIGGGHLMKLLGIHWGQFPELWEISGGNKSKQENEEGGELLIEDGKYIKGLSGMTCVVPAFDIHELLFDARLVEQRAGVEALLQT